MLQIGTKTPQFEGADKNGNIIRLSDFGGKKLALSFYPKEACRAAPPRPATCATTTTAS
ncbi:MAG: Bacterioferritin comigratory protein [bacterium P3]|nr:MAG: Bacterioferritin comigratory protein [bacterium P3]KWW42134.1 MAG: Bacterioferritin comigratory protein [bacterium F083]